MMPGDLNIKGLEMHNVIVFPRLNHTGSHNQSPLFPEKNGYAMKGIYHQHARGQRSNPEAYG